MITSAILKDFITPKKKKMSHALASIADRDRKWLIYSLGKIN